eukprot:g5645.t1
MKVIPPPPLYPPPPPSPNPNTTAPQPYQSRCNTLPELLFKEIQNINSTFEKKRHKKVRKVCAAKNHAKRISIENHHKRVQQKLRRAEGLDDCDGLIAKARSLLKKKQKSWPVPIEASIISASANSPQVWRRLNSSADMYKKRLGLDVSRKKRRCSPLRPHGTAPTHAAFTPPIFQEQKKDLQQPQKTRKMMHLRANTKRSSQVAKNVASKAAASAHIGVILTRFESQWVSDKLELQNKLKIAETECEHLREFAISEKVAERSTLNEMKNLRRRMEIADMKAEELQQLLVKTTNLLEKSKKKNSEMKIAEVKAFDEMKNLRRRMEIADMKVEELQQSLVKTTNLLEKSRNKNRKLFTSSKKRELEMQKLVELVKISVKRAKEAKRIQKLRIEAWKDAHGAAEEAASEKIMQLEAELKRFRLEEAH